MEQILGWGAYDSEMLCKQTDRNAKESTVAHTAKDAEAKSAESHWKRVQIEFRKHLIAYELNDSQKSRGVFSRSLSPSRSAVSR